MFNLPDIGPASDCSKNSATSRLITCANAGIFRHAIDQKFNGFGDSHLDLVNSYYALGIQTRDPGLILALNAHLWGGIYTIMRFANEGQKQQWLPLLLEAKIISGHAITEPQAGSSTQSLLTSYKIAGDQIIINGNKRYITNTPIAAMMIVYAKCEKSDKLSAFIIKKDDMGVQFCNKPIVDGCKTATMGDIILSNCEIPISRQLGKPGSGNTMIQLALERERAFIFSGIAGVMQWQLNTLIKHVNNREIGSDKLASHQAVSHRIAEMKVRLDTVRLWINHCANLLDQGKRITIESAQTKLYASEAFLQSSLDMVHLLGAYGLSSKYSDLVNDAMAGRLMSGTSEIQKNIIASMIGLRGSKN